MSFINIIFIFGVWWNIANPPTWKKILTYILIVYSKFLKIFLIEDYNKWLTLFEINVCGLSDNTKRNISKRAIADEEDIIEIKKDTMETELNEGLELISRDKDDLLIQNDENIENGLNINSNSNNI